MTSAEVHAVIAIVLGLALAYPALALLARALFPGTTAQAREHAAGRPVRSLLAGALVIGPGLVLTTLLGQAPQPGKTLSVLLVSALFFYAYLGAAGLATHVGERLASPADAARPWLATLRGAVVLELACGLPIVGWFVLAPLVFVVGAGATTIALFSRAPAQAPAPAPAPAEALVEASVP